MSRRRVSHITDLDNRATTGVLEEVAVTASPFVYQAQSSGFMVISGGSGITINYVRNGVSKLIGLTSGQFLIPKGDSLSVIYLTAPDMSFVPTTLV